MYYAAMGEVPLESFSGHQRALLTTYRSNGTPATWLVTLLVRKGHVYFRSYAASRKVRHLSENPDVEFAPSTSDGKLIGPPTRARARALRGWEAGKARWAFVQTQPIRLGLLLPLLHLFNRHRTVHFEFEPDGG